MVHHLRLNDEIVTEPAHDLTGGFRSSFHHDPLRIARPGHSNALDLSDLLFGRLAVEPSTTPESYNVCRQSNLLASAGCYV